MGVVDLTAKDNHVQANRIPIIRGLACLILILSLCGLITAACGNNNSSDNRPLLLPRSVNIDGSGDITVIATSTVNPQYGQKHTVINISNQGTFQSTFDIPVNTLKNWVYKSITDHEGNIIFYGTYSDFIEINSGTQRRYSSNGECDVLLCKFDAQANLEWAHTLGGTQDDVTSAVLVDNVGNIYIVGTFWNNLLLDNSIDIDINTPDVDYFLIKFDPDGNYIWGFPLGLINPFYAVDDNGSVSVIGRVDTTDPDITSIVNFEPVPDSSSSCLINFNSDGVFQWYKIIGGLQPGCVASANHIATGISGEIYVSGSYIGSVKFDAINDADPGISSVSHTNYLCKYGSEGDYEWAISWNPLQGRMKDIISDNYGNVFIVGDSIEEVAFAETGAPGEHEYDSGATYLTKLDSDGNIQWVETWKVDFHNAMEKLCTDNSGNIYVMGIYGWTGTVNDFDPGPEIEARTGTGIYLSKFSNDGQFSWVWTGLDETGE